MATLGDVYLDVHANTKGLPGEIRRGAKKIGAEGEFAGEKYSKGFDRGFSHGRRRSRLWLRVLSFPFRGFIGGLKETGRAMRGVFSGVAEGASELLKLGLSFKAMGIGAAGLAKGLLMVGARFGIMLIALSPLIAALSMLGGITVALAGSIGFALVGSIAALVAVIGPGVAALGVLGLAFIGMSDKAKKAVKTAFKPLRGELRELGKAARGPLLKALPGIVKNLEGPLRNLQPLVRRIGRAIGDVGLGFAKGFKTKGFKDFRNSMEVFLPNAIRRLGDISRQTLGGIGGLFRGMVPFMQDTLRSLDNLTARFSEWANSGRGQMAIESFFERAKASMKATGGLLRELGGLFGDLFSAGRGTGDSILEDMTNAIKGWREALKADPGILKRWFEDAKKFAGQLGELITGFGRLLDAMDSGAARDFWAVLKPLAATFGVLADAITLITDPLKFFRKAIAGAKRDWERFGPSITGGWNNIKAAFGNSIGWITDQLAGLLEGFADVAEWGNKILPGNPFGGMEEGARRTAAGMRETADAMKRIGESKPKGDSGLKGISNEAKDAKSSVESLWKLLSAGAPKPPKPKTGHPTQGGGLGGTVLSAELQQMKQLIIHQQKLGALPIIKPKVDGSAIKTLIRDSKQSAENLIKMGLIPPVRPKVNAAEIKALTQATGLGIKRLVRLGVIKVRPKASAAEIMNLSEVTGLSLQQLKRLGAFKGVKPTADKKQITALMEATGLSRRALEKLGLVKVKPKIDVQSNAEKQAAAARRAINSVKSKRVYIDTIYRRGNRSANPTSDLWTGGPVPGYARGGMLPGNSPGNKRLDNLLGMANGGLIGLRSGEYIMNEPATKMFEPLLAAMNRAGNSGKVNFPSRATGGAVDMSAPVPAAPGMTEAQMRRQAELNAQAMEKRTFRFDRQGNLRLMAQGGF